MEKNTCESCKYFYLHYVKPSQSYMATVIGHCIRYRTKIRKTDSLACEEWQARAPKRKSRRSGDDRRAIKSRAQPNDESR